MACVGLRNRFEWSVIALFVFGCGESSGDAAKPPNAAAGQNGAGTTSTSGAGGSGGSGQTGGGSSPGPADLTAVQACRDYFTAVCDRITECGAPRFRPCESPI